MSFFRLLILFVGLSLILGLSIWLVASLYSLYTQISFTAPFLANFLLLFLILFIGLLIGGFLYYFNFYTPGGSRKRRSRQSGSRVRRGLNKFIPESKTQAVTENLKAIGQQVGLIQDTVAREAILERSQEIKANLARGAIRIVVFGTGSAGKTSLINSLLGEIVGNVSSVMGTTTQGQTYSLKLQGVGREILITDTPGILEAGIAGTEREAIAKQLATEADLLLFVVDNDLRQSEYNPLYDLAKLGKRSLIVFNKTDLYTNEDRIAILEQLETRVVDLIAPGDIITVAASPQPVELTTGEIIEPEPEITDLLKRLVAVLRAEGEDLIADNILLQSHRLGEDARKIIDNQRRREADKIIDRYQWIGAGVIAVTPLPVVDMLATAAVNAQMVVEIGKIYGCEVDSEKGKELALSLGKTFISLGVVKGAIDLLGRALQFHFATYIVGKAIQAVSAAYLTRIAGKSFIEYFKRDRNWGDGGMAEVVQQQFQLTRKDEFVKAFVKDAITRVVQPMKDSWEEELEPIEEEW